ncbi:MAG TPA: VCBS repeat-containing protein, partial [Vicinamibacterales bacterium]
MTRRDFLLAMAAAAPGAVFRTAQLDSRVRFTDVTGAAGIVFQHNNGAYGGKLLPETLGSGCAFLDYDADGWIDVLLVNGASWPGHRRQRSTLRLYRNNRNGTFTDVTRRAGLDVEMYGMGV